MRELAATHRLERMRRLRMLKKQKSWKREAGFDGTGIIAGMIHSVFVLASIRNLSILDYITRDGLILRRGIS